MRQISVAQPTVKRIGLLVETSRSYGRRVLAGVERYMQGRERWALFVEPSNGTALPSFWQWPFDGLIVRPRSDEIAGAVLKRNVPRVLLSYFDPRSSHTEPNSQIAFASGTNHVLEGVAAAEHLRDRGFRNFAFYSARSLQDVAREQGFIEAVVGMGFTPSAFHEPSTQERYPYCPSDTSAAEQWLLSLRKPVGIMAYNDDFARRLAEVCVLLQLRVPDDIGIIGADDDSVMCQLASPHLSSVSPPYEELGFKVASMLDRLMRNQQVENLPVLAPTGVAARQSTNVQVRSDPVVIEALTYMRANLSRPIDIRDVVSHLTISRRKLERHFITSIGRTPAQELLRIRVENARHLLEQSDASISDVAARSGFANAARLTEAFRRYVGAPPGKYRRKMQSSSPVTI